MLYLITASNAMYSLLAHQPPGLQNLATAANIGCNTLNNLAEDQDFKVYATELARRRVANADAFDAITGRFEDSLNHFHSFMAEEKKVMRAAGFSSPLVRELARQGDELIQSVRGWNEGTEVLFRQVGNVRDLACTLAGELDRQSTQATSGNGGWRGSRGPVRRILYSVVGGAVIVLNAVASRNLSDPGTAVSYALGSALISQAIPPA